jgi:hypothetical protein
MSGVKNDKSDIEKILPPVRGGNIKITLDFRIQGIRSYF